MKLAVLYTGGTIGSVGDPLAPLNTARFNTAFEQVVTPVLKSQFPELVVSYLSFGTSTLDSTNLQPSDWAKIASIILSAYAMHDAFLILHGTDTMAFTSSALSFLFTALEPDGFPNAVLNKPVVITGSQVPLFYQAKRTDLPTLRFDTDAFQNVCGSVAAAFTGVPEVCLFFNNTLMRGNRAIKSNASFFNAFSTPNYPALGEQGIVFHLNNEHTLHAPTTPNISLDSASARERLADQLSFLAANISNTRVMPFLAFPAPYAGPDPSCNIPASSTLADILNAMLAQKVHGLVLESYGEGNFPSGDPNDAKAGAIYQALQAANDEGVIILDNTQVSAGIVKSNAYASGSWLASVGAVGAFDMTPIASYTKLVYLLTLRNYKNNKWSQADIKRLMQTNFTGEILDVNRLDTRGTRYLAPEESIAALDGSASLINDPAQGPILIDAAGNKLWTALTTPSSSLTAGGRLYMQDDGNLIFYDGSNKMIWASGTTFTGEAASMLILEGSSSPNGLRLYLYNYAQGIISKVLYPEMAT